MFRPGPGLFFSSGRVKNANQKECILIIDRETGEITIETLSSQILVKKTRAERMTEGSAVAAGGLTPTSTPAPSSAPPPPSRPQMPVERTKPPVPHMARPTPQPVSHGNAIYAIPSIFAILSVSFLLIE